MFEERRGVLTPVVAPEWTCVATFPCHHHAVIDVGVRWRGNEIPDVFVGRMQVPTDPPVDDLATGRRAADIDCRDQRCAASCGRPAGQRRTALSCPDSRAICRRGNHRRSVKSRAITGSDDVAWVGLTLRGH